MGFKKGDKVRLVDTKGLLGYSFSHHIKKNKVYTVRRVKSTGGLCLEEFCVGHSDERFGSGDEQGIMGNRFVKVKSQKRKICKKK